MNAKRVAMALLLVGVSIGAFSVVWLVAVSPSVARLPADFRRSETLQGSYAEWDAASGTLVLTPVTLRMEWVATGVRDGALLLTESSETDEPHPAFPSTTQTLVVDRESRSYLSGTDGDRQGQFMAPPGVKRGDSFLVWVGPVGWPVRVAYAEESREGGAKLLTFRGEVRDLPLPREPSGIIQHSADVTLELRVEPRTGYVVERRERIEVKITDPKVPQRTSTISDLHTSDEDVFALVSQARSARLHATLLSTFMPWAALGLGLLLVAEGGLLWWVVQLRRRASSTASPA